MNHRPFSNGLLFVAITLGLAMLAVPVLLFAQTPGPLEADAPVASTEYQSPLVDFRAFDPDENMESWVDANHRVGEIGGWRTYLREANPPKKPMQKESPSEAPTPPKDKVASISQPGPATPIVKSDPTVPALAEGGRAQKDAMLLPLPKLPKRFSRGECPRVLTGLRLPISARAVRLAADAEQLLLSVLKCFSSRRYVIGGHTDGRGPLNANQTLSQSRADAVRAFLIANGVDPQRIISRGFGESRPVDTNRTKRGRARNRRIDFTLDR